MPKSKSQHKLANAIVAAAKAIPSLSGGGPSSVQQSEESKKRENDYRAEDDLRTLTRAEEIRGDKERMHHAGRKHREQVKAIANTGRVFARSKGRSMSAGR